MPVGKLNFGIIGTGAIAKAHAEGLRYVPDACLHSVVSRHMAQAEAFSKRFAVKRLYDSLDAFLEDVDLDVVLVATPHPMHFPNTLMSLQAGKHVVCEKPMGLNRRQVAEMIDTARQANKFLMEAMWMWFNPATARAKALIDAGEIGEPRLLLADFGFAAPQTAHSRLFDPALGGGALLDIGIYPLALALYLFGVPQTVNGTAFIGATGVDEQISMVLRYADGKQASLCATLQADTPCEAVICGTHGHLRMLRNFWHTRQLRLLCPKRLQYTLRIPTRGNMYNYELNHVVQMINAGKVESDVMTWQSSLDLAQMMDTLRSQWGMTYPGE